MEPSDDIQYKKGIIPQNQGFVLFFYFYKLQCVCIIECVCCELLH